MLDLTDGSTIAWAIGAIVSIVVAFAVVGFALWYSGDEGAL
jgi:hypothetical protein